ncbi:hypothetical protein LB517_27905 [Mesorhizobium sp. BR1-1-12]|uniref:hypothetical protein n=1 Tax=Mesorhizobium sp. BR1-1-12 TaxID=2876657 RepID=UPI001CD1791D|nr:hypothetical protein [Mesorhizobium sp. BR1-1-12]MBZ9973458.1 hypothetical protein [Mesorhizobium sp. BR1-1-12]
MRGDMSRQDRRDLIGGLLVATFLIAIFTVAIGGCTTTEMPRDTVMGIMGAMNAGR